MDVEMESTDVVSADDTTRWNNLDKLFSTAGPMAGADFAPMPGMIEMIRENIRLLVIGAGGLGCELLKDLAMSGFKNIDVIDMDTIDLSNLNRQFLFRHHDIGKSKAEVAAAFINKRVPGCKVTPHFCKIQDFGEDFYRGFHMVICGLDSVVARRWMNGMLLGLLQYDGEELREESIIPLIDGGTEGFKGNARVILPGKSACIECNLDLYPQQINYPLCTIAETPRLPEHCIEYVKVIQWPKEMPFGAGINVDGDDANHVSWIFEKACERAETFGISGVTYMLTKGVIKHIIPAVASTNAVIAAISVLETIKVLTACYAPIQNYMMFNDSQGVYTYVFEAEKKDDCPACCTKPVDISFPTTATLQDVIDYLKNDPAYQLHKPSVTTMVGDRNKTLYMPNIPFLEEQTRGNLEMTMADLEVRHEQLLSVTDVTSPKALSFKFLVAS